MKLLYNPISLEHQTGNHPENARRLEVLAQHFRLPETTLVDGEPYLRLIHDPDYIELVRSACREARPLDADTVTSPGSWAAAMAGVGLTLLAAEQNDFALVRPPGHHAHRKRASGFCLFNNIAIATQRLVTEDRRRVAIIDFDGHLGDGTQSIFYESGEVLFVSIHQFPAFPYEGFIDQIGSGPGRGFNINIPVPPGAGDDIYLDALQLFLPIVEQFQPDVVAVSAGFDAHIDDPLLNLKYSVHAFYETARVLRERFSRVFAVLEGGYNLEALPWCVESFLAGINRKPLPHPAPMTMSGLRVWETYEINAYAALGKLREFWVY